MATDQKHARIPRTRDVLVAQPSGQEADDSAIALDRGTDRSTTEAISPAAMVAAAAAGQLDNRSQAEFLAVQFPEDQEYAVIFVHEDGALTQRPTAQDCTIDLFSPSEFSAFNLVDGKATGTLDVGGFMDANWDGGDIWPPGAGSYGVLPGESLFSHFAGRVKCSLQITVDVNVQNVPVIWHCIQLRGVDPAVPFVLGEDSYRQTAIPITRFYRSVGIPHLPGDRYQIAPSRTTGQVNMNLTVTNVKIEYKLQIRGAVVSP